MKKVLLREALSIARGEMGHHPEWSFYMHWSFIVAENRIVEWGTNAPGDPPKHFGYHPQSKIHSELRAWNRAKGLLAGAPFSLINIRLNRRGEWRMSAPCAPCQGWLESVGCRKIWFTTPNGWAQMECS